ncbi:MAG: hypothetical protein KGL11_07490 [Alphaproteobacteria bacterium]|nr:hypothetical protein [Alphaproteobacteria bacterium]
MKTWLVLAVAALATGCVPVDRDPARDVIGVSAASDNTGDASADAAAQKLLAGKAGQICAVPGYDVAKKDVEPAEGNQRIVDWELRCAYYTHVSLF